MNKTDDLEKRLAEIEARERRVAERERAVSAKSIKRNLYDRINVSVRTMDVVIAVCAAAIVGLVALGVIFGKGR